ncbi:MAG: LysR family transcriptional regulator [Paracoccaceae bacterium]
MDKTSSHLDWTLVQSFAAVTSEGSLSGAARKLRQSQPTIGRHIKALESALGVDLFTRTARGLTPTDAGLEILDYAREMEQVAARLRLAAEGRADDLSGTVRITASVVMSHLVLPEIIAEMRQTLPDIQIELVPSDTTENLIFREADIAIRMYRPTQLDVITRHITDSTAGIYAATNYLDRVGRPTSIDEGMAMDFVGFDKLDLIIRTMGEIGLHVTREFFPVRCDDQAVYWNLVCAGCGIGAAQVFIGDTEPRVERIMPDLVLPNLPIWLAAPEALRSNKRIRAVWDHLAIAVAARTGA